MGAIEKIIKDFDEVVDLRRQIKERQVMLRMQETELKDELINQRMYDFLSVNYARLGEMIRRMK